MITNNLSKKILSIGCEYIPPKGGIAQVLCNYGKFIYPQFNCITNSGNGNIMYKLWKAFTAIINLFVVLLFNKEITIIHIHTASYSSFKRSSWFVRLGKVMNRKVILHIHGGGFKEYYQTNPEFITKILNSCDCIITLSLKWKEYFRAITSCPMIEVVSNIVSPPIKMNVSKNDGKIHFLYLGLITELKGIFDLLELLVERQNELRGKLILHIGGNGKVEELKDFIKTNKIDDMAIYEGWVAGDRKDELLNMADVFILPSYTEGLPVSILEAMSYSLPILSTTVGGIPEIVENGINGFLITPGDKDALYAALMGLVSDAELRKSMGKNSYERVQPHFPDNVGRVIEKIYTSLE